MTDDDSLTKGIIGFLVGLGIAAFLYILKRLQEKEQELLELQTKKSMALPPPQSPAFKSYNIIRNKEGLPVSIETITKYEEDSR